MSSLPDLYGKTPTAAFPISDEEFVKLRDYFYHKVGIQFAESKRYFVDKRVADRAAIKGCATFREYFMLLRLDSAGGEIQELINTLTVNETYFFREKYQLDSLTRFALPEIAARKRLGDRIRIWSLPCSTGEEPYSIAITVLDDWALSDAYQIEILGSDVDTRVLMNARAGLYGPRSLQNVGLAVRNRYFRPAKGDEYQIIPELRDSIEFFQLNINAKSEMARYRDIDIIFCRNLLIYFDDVSRREAVESIFESLVPGGFVFLGHAESMSRMSSLFIPRRLGDSTVYQRPPEVK